MRKTDLFLDARGTSARSYHRKGYLQAGDAIDFLSGLSPSIADVVFLDPPFNLGKKYETPSPIESAAPEVYRAYMEYVLAESVRVLKPGGSLFLYHLPYWASVLSQSLNHSLTFRHWIAVSMKNGFVRGDRLYPAHYALLYYTKGAPVVFNRPKLKPQRCRHCDGLVKNYGGYTSIIKEKGINLSDVWEDLSPVRHRSTKNRQANELPTKLTDRVLEISGRPGGLVVEPFCGSGSMLVSALDAKMGFLANDLSKRSIEMTRARLDEHM